MGPADLARSRFEDLAGQYSVSRVCQLIRSAGIETRVNRQTPHETCRGKWPTKCALDLLIRNHVIRSSLIRNHMIEPAIPMAHRPPSRLQVSDRDDSIGAVPFDYEMSDVALPHDLRRLCARNRPLGDER